MCYTLNMTQWGWKPAKQGHRRAEGEAGAWKGEQARCIRYACHVSLIFYYSTYTFIPYQQNPAKHKHMPKWACIWHPPPLQLMLWHDGGVFDLPSHQNVRWGVCSSTTTPSAHVSMQQHQEKGRMIILSQFTLIYRELYKSFLNV